MQIQEITIRNLGVIDAVQVAFAPGLTVITGETGAGKTMLVTALQLALGARADQNLVRDGADKATIDVLCLDTPTTELTDAPDGHTIITREIPATGRSVARIDGRPVPVALLEELFGRRVEVHAQHTHVRLSRSDTQRDLLDRYAGDEHAATVARYQKAFDNYQTMSRRYDEQQATASERVREVERLTFEIEEIEAAEIMLPDDNDVDERIARLAHADQLAAAARTASVLLDADHSAGAVGEAVQELRHAAGYDPALADIADTAAGFTEELVLLSRTLRQYADTLDTDPATLNVLQERKQVLSTLMRKYGATLQDVLAYASTAKQTLTQFASDDPAILLQERADALRVVQEAGASITHGRRQAAKQLQTVVASHLADLGMPHAAFVVDVADQDPQRNGCDKITFLLAPNPGESAQPIADAVSGGERSRVALAIEVALADVDDADVLVFDEVDAGIGGQTALAVGEKLARLAAPQVGRQRQVMCVTHLAQLAVFADVHHVVEKQVQDGRTRTTVRQVADEKREEELSRLLGGVVATEGVEHARVLMQTARTRLANQN